MEFEQLTGRYLRLRRELSAAYEARPWHSGQIDRLVDQIAQTEREMAAMSPGSPSAGESDAVVVRRSLAVGDDSGTLA